VVDAGHKSHAIDSGLQRPRCRDELEFANGGDEHGIVWARSASSALPGPADTVWLVPGHCDPTANLHDTIVGVHGGIDRGVVERVIRVDARGCVA
jgi:D-serine deaminase-like pyridoxal phosphate-dependent protein